ncbi:helix-turn-helix transcriptional regulator [Novosphingobium sp. G106]|uniref:helix-turn-helix domain-containing protein n=1 Tax=Novosphingobium sp. G106 TaxID=2849500 RepID=UPI001C2DD125|nr:helix-turn-helix transcriptional regulator [Novosphingobium sp. G106]
MNRTLSGRELEVARFARFSLSSKEIARMLRVCDGTVKKQLHHILPKLHLNSRVDLVRLLPAFQGAQNPREEMPES